MFVWMKNITLSADAALIERARELARSRRSTLNQLFRDWLRSLTEEQDRQQRLAELEQRLSYARAGGKFTRDQMNER
jgi:predicted transcriptional regulator